MALKRIRVCEEGADYSESPGRTLVFTPGSEVSVAKSIADDLIARKKAVLIKGGSNEPSED